jgi:hypothetical protein
MHHMRENLAVPLFDRKADDFFFILNEEVFMAKT